MKSYGIYMNFNFNPGAGKHIPQSEFDRNRKERIKYPTEFKLTHFNEMIMYNLRIGTSKARLHDCQHPICLKCACLMFHLHSRKKKKKIKNISPLVRSNLNACVSPFTALPTIGLFYSPGIVL